MKFTSGSLAALAAFAIAGASSAFAADLAVHKTPPKPAAPNFNWTGWYGGFNYGTGVAQTHGDSGPPEIGTIDRAGSSFSVGVHGGYNWQYAPRWVGGFEADIGWLGIDRTLFDWAGDGTFSVKSNWYATLRGRLGYSNGPSLFYVTGGGAIVDLTNRADFNGALSSGSRIAGGWTAGGGVETMLGGNWTARAEYLYIDAGGQDVFNPGGGGSTIAFDNRFHVFRNALSYRFGGAPSAAAALPAYSWTGFYVGLHGGAAAAQAINIVTPPAVGSLDIADTGYAAGVQAGYNWQLVPAWIVGVEADIGLLDISRSTTNFGSPGFVHGIEADWYGTVRARIGRSTGPALLYATGGVAFTNVTNIFNDLAASGSKTKVTTGWTVGGGIEAALGNGWTGKTEYLFIDASSQGVPGAFFGTTTRFDNRFHVFRFGVNRQFASGVAR